MTDKKANYNPPTIEFVSSLSSLDLEKYDALIYLATDFESIPEFPGSEALKSTEEETVSVGPLTVHSSEHAPGHLIIVSQAQKNQARSYAEALMAALDKAKHHSSSNPLVVLQNTPGSDISDSIHPVERLVQQTYSSLKHNTEHKKTKKMPIMKQLNIGTLFNKKKVDDDSALSPRSKQKTSKVEDDDETIRFWHIPGSPSSRILWLIGELDSELFDQVKITILKNAKDIKHWFPKENSPVHSVPVLRFGGHAEPIWESGSIIASLLDRYKNHTLVPETWDDKVWARHHLYTYWSLLTLDPKILNKRAQNRWKAFEKVLSDDLGENEYIQGNEFTLTDILIGFSLHLAHEQGLLKHSPKPVIDYYQRISQRKAFITSLSSEPQKESAPQSVTPQENDAIPPVQIPKETTIDEEEKTHSPRSEEKTLTPRSGEEEVKEVTLNSIAIHMYNDANDYSLLARALYAIEKGIIEAGNKLNNYDFAKLALTAMVGPLIREGGDEE